MAKRLNDAQIDFIRVNRGKLTQEEIAKQIGCSTESIRKYYRKFDKENSDTVAARDKQAKAVLGDHVTDVPKFFRDELLNSERGKTLRKTLIDEHWEFFVEQWVNYCLQLPNLTHSEMNTIEQLIMLKIAIVTNRETHKQNLESKKAFLLNLDISKLDVDDEDDQAKIIMAQQFDTTIIDLNRDYKDLLERYVQIDKSMNMTREQREKSGKIGGDTFFSLVKKFEDKLTQRKEGRMAEIFKIAKEKKNDDLRKNIQYMDGDIKPQLLDHISVENKEEKVEE